MSLHVALDPGFPIPENGLAVVAQAILPVLQNSDHGVDRGKIFENMKEGVKALTPHKVYETDLDGIKSGDCLGKAEMVGWRYILFSGDGEVSLAAAEIAIEEGSQQAAFLRVARRPDVEATVAELEQSKMGPKVAGDKFELRYLRIWDVNFFGLWLHCTTSPEKSFVIPLPPVPPGLEVGEDISRAMFNERIKAVAQGVVERFLKSP